MNNKYLNSLHSLNFFNLALKCPVLIEAKTKQIYTNDTINDLIVFENIDNIYLNNIHNFCSFLIFKIFKNSYKESKNILEYESYFYQTVLGFCLKYFDEKYFNSKIVATYWKLVLDIQVKILSLLKREDIKSLEFNKYIYLNCKHINSNVKPFSYFINSLITINYLDGTYTVIDILPFNKTSLNLYNLSLVKYYNSSLRNTYIFYINLNSPSYSFKNFDTSSKLNKLLNIYNNFVIDFSTPNLFNCSNCYFKNNCNDKYKITPVIPDIHFVKRKIALKQIE